MSAKKLRNCNPCIYYNSGPVDPPLKTTEYKEVNHKPWKAFLWFIIFAILLGSIYLITTFGDSLGG
jgi:hypothetical protein